METYIPVPRERVEVEASRILAGWSFQPIRFDANAMRPDRREYIAEWVKSLGVEPNDVRGKGVIVMGERGYELHLSKFVCNERGGHIFDRATNDSVSQPLIIDLGTDLCWPAWLDASSTEGL